jgi:hypothetical protein
MFSTSNNLIQINEKPRARGSETVVTFLFSRPTWKWNENLDGVMEWNLIFLRDSTGNSGGDE